MSHRDICNRVLEHQLQIAKEARKTRKGTSMGTGAEINMHVDLQTFYESFTDMALSFLTARAKRETW